MTRREHTGVQEWPAGSGRYRIDYRDAQGRRRREMVGNKKLAIEVYHRRKAEILEGRYKPPRRERKTFSEVMAEYLQSKEGRVSDQTQHNNRLRAGVLQPLLGHELIDKIDAHLLTKTLTKIKSDRVASGPTLNRYRAQLSGMFNFGIVAKYVEANPVIPVERYPEPKGRNRYLSADEETALRKAIREIRSCNDTYRELEFDLALFTGFRKGEQYRAKWSKVDLVNRFMTVLGKSRGQVVERTIPLNPMAVDTLEKLYSISGHTSYVIPVRRVRWAHNNREGKKDERGWFDVAVEAAGIQDFSWHDLRHTFASRAVMAGVPLRTVMEWLGHRNIRTTMIYAHLAPGHHWEEMKKLVDTRKEVTAMDTGNSSVTQISDFKASK